PDRSPISASPPRRADPTRTTRTPERGIAMKRSIAVPAGAGLVILALTLASCSGSAETPPSSDGEVVSGGTFQHAVFPEVGSIIPMSATQPQEIQVITYAYETLIYTDQ